MFDYDTQIPYLHSIFSPMGRILGIYPALYYHISESSPYWSYEIAIIPPMPYNIHIGRKPPRDYVFINNHMSAVMNGKCLEIDFLRKPLRKNQRIEIIVHNFSDFKNFVKLKGFAYEGKEVKRYNKKETPWAHSTDFMRV